jgi:hypothetical protein
VTAAASTEGKITENQIKEQDKREDALEKHQEKVGDIEAKFYKERERAQREFEQTMLDTDANIYDGLINLENQNVAKQYDAQYQSFLQGLPAIAAEKGADVADAYAQAYEQVLLRRARAQQDIEKAREEGNSGRAEALEGVEAKRQTAENRRLQEVLEGRNNLREQEQRELGNESENWEAAQAKIDESSERTTEKIERQHERRVAAINRETAAANNAAKAHERNEIASASANTKNPTTTSSTTSAGASAEATTTPTADGGTDAILQGLAQVKNAIDTLAPRVEAVEKAVRDAGRGVEGAIDQSTNTRRSS